MKESIRDAFESRYVQYSREKDKKSSIKEYLEKVRSLLQYVIDDLKISDEWKIHLTTKCKFLSSADSNEKRILRVIAV